MSWKYSGIVKALTHLPNGRKLTANEKLFLLILADYSNEAMGTSWPSVQRLSRECLCSDRTVQKMIKRLARSGFLVVEQRSGMSSKYTLRLDRTPEESSPPKLAFTPTPEAATSPKPSLEPSLKEKHIRMAQLPTWLPVSEWNAYLDMRKGKGVPLVTSRAIGMAINKLEKLRDCGQDPKAILEQSIFSGWTGLFEIRQSNAAIQRKPDIETDLKPLPRSAYSASDRAFYDKFYAEHPELRPAGWEQS